MTTSNSTEAFRLVSALCDDWHLHGPERFYVIRRAGQLIDILPAEEAFNQALVEQMNWFGDMMADIL